MNKISVSELTTFSMLGAIMFVSKILMQWIPNVHLLAMFVAAFTVTYRAKALLSLYVYILLDGAFFGFSMWWLPYLYIWLPLWGAVMLVSKMRLPRKAQAVAYMMLCCLHGLSFGTLYAPVQALMFGLSFKATIAWIVAGLPFDVIHGISNFVSAAFVIPLSALLKKIGQNSVR